jgi:hypothetical protein
VSLQSAVGSLKIGASLSPKCLEVDFSHLRAKGIEIRSSPQCPRSSDCEVPTTPCRPWQYGFFGPLRAPFLKVNVFQHLPRFFSRASCFYGSLRQTDP